MPSKGSLSSLGLLFFIKLSYISFLFITLASTTPISDLGPTHAPRHDAERVPLHTFNHRDEGKSLAKRKSDPSIYATGWFIGQDTTGNQIYGFGASVNQLPSGIVTTGKEIGRGANNQIFQASLFDFSRPRAVNTNTASHLLENERVQHDLAAKYSEHEFPYDGALIMEKLKASGAVPEVYKALKLPLGPCFEGSLVVTEKLDKSAMGMLQEYATKPFNRLIMMQQWVKGLAYAHEKGIAHRDANPGNLMKVFHRDEWKIIDWDHAYDFGRKPENMKETMFLNDVRKVGISLVFAASPRLIQTKPKRAMVTRLISRHETEDPTNLKQALENELNLKGHDEFLTIVSETGCARSKRLSMEELNSKLQDFPGHDLPLFE